MTTLARLSLNTVTVTQQGDGSVTVLGGGLPVFLSAQQADALRAALPLTGSWSQFVEVQ